MMQGNQTKSVRQWIGMLALALLGGCSSDQQYLDAGRGEAIAAALDRGRFELECPAATGTVLSQELVQRPMVGWRTIAAARSEYTVGVEGCGQRRTYGVVCRQGGGGCFAAS